MTTPGSGSATKAPQYDDEDLRMAHAVLTQPLEEAVISIVTLTDEELLAIEGIQHRQLMPLPWVAENLRTDEERAVAAATATRGLIARGLVRSEKVKDPLRPDEKGPADEIAPALRGTVVARRTSDQVVVAERKTSLGTATSVFYLFDLPTGGRVLWELFDDQGVHVFSVLDLATLPEQLIRFADPVGGIGDEDGEPLEIPAPQFPASEKAQELQGARALTSVVLRARGEDEAATFNLFGMPDRTELMETEDSEAGGVVRIAPISRAGLEELVASLVDGGEAAPA